MTRTNILSDEWNILLQMLQDLDATLATLVGRELATENVAISFAAPDE